MMYIWVAADVNSQLIELRKKVEEVSEELMIYNTALTLPLHVSLRISFPVDDSKFERICDYILKYYKTVTPFEVETAGIEQRDQIIWCKIVNHPRLSDLHKYLVDSLKEKFDIGTHMFDEYFMYHASLVIADNLDKANEAYKRLKNEKVPKVLKINHLVLGVSETGKPGEYRVFKDVFIPS